MHPIPMQQNDNLNKYYALFLEGRIFSLQQLEITIRTYISQYNLVVLEIR